MTTLICPIDDNALMLAHTIVSAHNVHNSSNLEYRKLMWLSVTLRMVNHILVMLKLLILMTR